MPVSTVCQFQNHQNPQNPHMMLTRKRQFDKSFKHTWTQTKIKVAGNKER